jgi:hypothetical protein
MAYVKKGKKLRLGFIQWDSTQKKFTILRFEWTFLQNLVNPLIVRVWTKLHKACDKGRQNSTIVKNKLAKLWTLLGNHRKCPHFHNGYNTHGSSRKEFYSESFKLGMKKCLAKFDNGSALHTLFRAQHYEKSFSHLLEC